jgi:hypothetical protein
MLWIPCGSSGTRQKWREEKQLTPKSPQTISVSNGQKTTDIFELEKREQ